jgi:hypothetical protein
MFHVTEFDGKRAVEPMSKSRGTRSSWPSLAAGVYVSALALILPLEEPKIPRDFRVVAEYGRGYSDWSSWETVIDKNGRVIQVDQSNDIKKEIVLSQKELGDILKAVKTHHFFDLKESYSCDVSDNPCLILTITLDGRTHKVQVYAPAHQLKDKDVKRFFEVWYEVLAKVPSPNRAQKPGHYDKH